MATADRVVIVTGAGSGIGRATAQRFAREGARVTVADISEEGATKTVEMIEAENGRATAVTIDVADRSAVDRMVADTVRRDGGLDVMISNAGIAVDSSFLDTTEAELDRILNVNLKGVFFCGQAAARAMIEGGRGGCIVNTASTYAEVAAVGSSAYCATKAGVRMLTKAMGLELGPRGIRVNAVAPGWIRTGMAPHDDPAAVERLEATIPVLRIGTPDDIADVMFFLASADARYVNGETVFVDGGWIVQ